MIGGPVAIFSEGAGSSLALPSATWLGCNRDRTFGQKRAATEVRSLAGYSVAAPDEHLPRTTNDHDKSPNLTESRCTCPRCGSKWLDIGISQHEPCLFCGHGRVCVVRVEPRR